MNLSPCHRINQRSMAGAAARPKRRATRSLPARVLGALRRFAALVMCWLVGAGAIAADAVAPIELRVDATDEAQQVLRVSERIPATAGPMRLLFPRWLPGFHGPYGDVTQLAGLEVRAAGQRLPWRRDPLDPHAFVIDVPASAPVVELSFQSLTASESQPYRPPWARLLLGLQWHAMVLYPAGRPVAEIVVQPSVRLPAGWHHGSALRVRSERDGWLSFEPVSLETLVDSPLYAGLHHRRLELDPPGTAQPVVLQLFGDSTERLQPSEAQIEAHRALVRQATALFGARPWRHYDLLIATGEGLPSTALEHRESSENVYPTDYFKDWAGAIRSRDDVAHELAHAWNGKFRRPADLWAGDFNTPTQNNLLWVYEGLTEYYGMVLAARAGLASPELIRHRIGRSAAYLRDLPGRRWRNLQDTTNDPTIASSAETTWQDWQRSHDYYLESALLIWLDADTLIRQATGGARSLDDFARRFFAGGDSRLGTSTYEFKDVVFELNAIHPHDWPAFLRERLDRTAAQVKLDGLERSGWQVVFADKRSEMDLAALHPKKPILSLQYSLGMGVAPDGKLAYVAWDGPAFRAGLSQRDQVVAVGMQGYTDDRLEAAIAANRDGSHPISLLIKRDDQYRVLSLDVRTGLRYPKLERIDGAPDLLGAVFAPR